MRAVQLPTGSAMITSGLNSASICRNTDTSSSSRQQKHPPVTSATDLSPAEWKVAVSIRSSPWSLATSPGRNPLALNQAENRWISVVFPAPRNPPIRASFLEVGAVMRKFLPSPPPLGVKQNLKSIKQHEQFHHKTVFHQAKCRRNSCGIKSHTLFRISECKLLDWFISFQVDMPVGYRMARDPVCWT